MYTAISANRAEFIHGQALATSPPAEPVHITPPCTPLRCSKKQNSMGMFDGTSLRVAWFYSSRQNAAHAAFTWSILHPARSGRRTTSRKDADAQDGGSGSDGSSAHTQGAKEHAALVRPEPLACRERHMRDLVYSLKRRISAAHFALNHFAGGVPAFDDFFFFFFFFPVSLLPLPASCAKLVVTTAPVRKIKASAKAPNLFMKELLPGQYIRTLAVYLLARAAVSFGSINSSHYDPGCRKVSSWYSLLEIAHNGT
jgi:hypothetical protein